MLYIAIIINNYAQISFIIKISDTKKKITRLTLSYYIGNTHFYELKITLSFQLKLIIANLKFYFENYY